MTAEPAAEPTPTESVWDYPRPPRVERTTRELRVVLGGQVVARTRRALRVLETSHPPSYYLPSDDVHPEALRAIGGRSYCEWKGIATYYDVCAGAAIASRGAWTYLAPRQPYAELTGYVAFYAAPMDRCEVDGEIVVPQPGERYGGWITADIVGPFTGE